MSPHEATPHEQKKRPWYVLPTGLVARIGYPLMGIMHNEIYRIVAPHADLQPEDDLIDIACGSGHFLKKYASHVRSVAGLHLSQMGIERATKKHADRVSAGVYDIYGRLVENLADPVADQSCFDLTWDGTDSTGRPCHAGVYFVRLRTPGFSHSAKVVLSR